MKRFYVQYARAAGKMQVVCGGEVVCVLSESVVDGMGGAGGVAKLLEWAREGFFGFHAHFWGEKKVEMGIKLAKWAREEDFLSHAHEIA